MNKNFLSEILHNKNIIMFITSIIYILGLYTFFTNNGIFIALTVSVIFIILLCKSYTSPKLILLWIIIFYSAYMNCLFQIKDTDTLFKYAPFNGTITGQIKSIPNSNVKDKSKFYFFVKSIDINGENISDINSTVFVTVESEKEDFSSLKIGNYYKMKGALRKPFSASNPSQFDYGKYLRNFGTFTVFYANIEDIKEIQAPISFKTKFLQSLNDLRNRIISTHSKYLKSPNVEILGGIIFGDDAIAPPPEIKTSFINSGLLHILAASGMNVAFIYGFWYFALKRLRIPYKFILISGIGMIILYSLMTGLGASVIRAAFMLIFILIGKLIDRDTHSVALLSLVALIMLIYNPAYINDVGFQLSFLVTFGLLTTANVVFEKFDKVPKWLSSTIFIPVVAQVWVIPLQMFYFNTISIYSVFANILTVPFLWVISFMGFLSSVLSIFEPISDFVCRYTDVVLNQFLNIIVIISNYFAGFKNSLFITTHPSVLQVLVYYAAVLLLTLHIKTGFKNNKTTILTCSLILFLAVSAVNIPSKNLELTVFEVQNADAFLVKTPENKYFIIDTGKSGYNGGSPQARAIILKYMKDKGIKNIEGLIITHFDNDHSGGAVEILRNSNVKNVYINSLTNDSDTSSQIYNEIKNKSVKLPKNKEKIYEEKDFEIITYQKDNTKDDNENSIITLLKHKDINILMMGDASMDRLEGLPDKVQIIKVGHHGAKSVVNTNLLKSLNTEATIISTGYNIFGHPHPTTLKQLEKTKIYRTDKHHSIKIILKGSNYEIYTYDIKSRKYIPGKA